MVWDGRFTMHALGSYDGIVVPDVDGFCMWWGKRLVSVSCDMLLLRQVTRELIDWQCVSGCVRSYCLGDDFMPNAVEFSANWEAEMQSLMRGLEIMSPNIR